MIPQQCDFIEMKIPAKPEYVGVIRLTVSGIANRIGYTYDDIEDIKIAVAEACTNVVEHAYEGNGLISVSFQVYSDQLDVVVADQGCSFDLNSFKEKLGPLDSDMPVTELKEGGLGLYLINSLMDKVEITSDNGIILRMTKFLSKDGVERYVDETSATTVQKQG